jgi:hypothetical protein
VADVPVGDGEAPGPPGQGPGAPQGGPGASGARPAYYAASPGRWRDWWTLLHPPYTAWHLSYTIIGASLAPRVDLSRLLWTVAAFFLAVGVAAHALDELRGRPLRTNIPAGALTAAVTLGLAGAVGMGAYGVTKAGWVLVPFMVAGPALVIAYNAELFGGALHNDLGFVAQAGGLATAPVAAAAAALALSMAQRRLSTPARNIRRRAVRVDGSITFADGRTTPIDAGVVLEPLEGALRAMSWGLVLLAAALAIARLT